MTTDPTTRTAAVARAAVALAHAARNAAAAREALAREVATLADARTAAREALDGLHPDTRDAVLAIFVALEGSDAVPD